MCLSISLKYTYVMLDYFILSKANNLTCQEKRVANQHFWNKFVDLDYVHMGVVFKNIFISLIVLTPCLHRPKENIFNVLN